MSRRNTSSRRIVRFEVGEVPVSHRIKEIHAVSEVRGPVARLVELRVKEVRVTGSDKTRQVVHGFTPESTKGVSGIR